MHYLLNQEKLPQTGTYFGLALNEKAPPEQAIQKAFGMSSVQMEQAVKDYFHSLSVPKSRPQPSASASVGGGLCVHSPSGLNEVGVSRQDVLLPEARALVDEVMIRIPEHRDEALKQLNALLGPAKGRDRSGAPGHCLGTPGEK